MLEMMEWIVAMEAATLLTLWIQWIDAHIELFAFFWIGEHLFSCRDIDEFLFGQFLLIALIRIRMPFLSHFTICFDNLLLCRRSWHTQYLIIISTFGLFLPCFNSFDALFGSLQVLIDFQRRLIIVNGCKMQ